MECLDGMMEYEHCHKPILQVNKNGFGIIIASLKSNTEI